MAAVLFATAMFAIVGCSKDEAGAAGGNPPAAGDAPKAAEPTGNPSLN
jgi:hypothetical protein